MTEVIDANEYLIEFLASIDNLPSEIKHHSFELKSKEDEIKELLRNISARERRLFALLDGIPLDSLSSSSSSENEYSSDSEYRRPRKRRILFADENEEELVRKIKADYSRAEQLQDEKVMIAEKMVGLVERHVNRMDEDFEVLFPQYHLKDSVIAPEENLETDLGVNMFDPLQELPTETEESHFGMLFKTSFDSYVGKYPNIYLKDGLKMLIVQSFIFKTFFVYHCFVNNAFLFSFFFEFIQHFLFFRHLSHQQRSITYVKIVVADDVLLSSHVSDATLAFRWYVIHLQLPLHQRHLLLVVLTCGQVLR